MSIEINRSLLYPPVSSRLVNENQIKLIELEAQLINNLIDPINNLIDPIRLVLVAEQRRAFVASYLRKI